VHKDKRFLVFEIEEGLIKAAFIENFTGNIIVKDLSIFSRNEKEKPARIKSKNTIVLVPPKKGMIRYLDLPSLERAELKDMINFQLPRYLPYNFGDIIFDFKVVQEKKEGYAKVMVVCIQKELFNEILGIIPNLEDSLYGVFLCGEVGIDLLRASQKDKKGVQALVDISSEEVILSIFDSTGILFMRSLNTAFFIRESEWPKGFEELERTFISFSREFSENKIESIVITGAKTYPSNFHNFLKEHSRYPVELFNPFDHVQCEKVRTEKLNNFSFNAIIGAGMATERRRINLIPQGFLSKKEKRLRKSANLYVLLLAIIIIFQLSFILYRGIAKKKTYLNYLRAQIRKTEPKAKVIEDKERKTLLIKAQLDMEGSSLDVVREVYHIISPNISINILIFEKNKSLSIRGTARTMAEVFNLIPQLEKSPYFVRVISEGTKMRKLKGDVVADFQIRALFKKSKEE